MRRLGVTVDACEFKHLGDTRAEPVQNWCDLRAAENMSTRTRNTYTGSLRAFVRWCVRDRRLASDPLETLSKADEATDVRRERRALTEDELARLLHVAELRPLGEYGRETEQKLASEGKGKRATWTKRPLTFETIDAAADRAAERLRENPEFVDRKRRLGRERVLTYKTLILTGLRRGELATLRWGDLELDGTQPYLIVRAKNAKNRKQETVAIRPDLANALQAWRSECGNPANSENVFNVPTSLVRILDNDLAVAGIPKTDADGRTIDVHALRHTTATYLARAGVAPRTAQSIMRHSDIRLTLGTYTDPTLLNSAEALEALPNLDAGSGGEGMRATGTCDPGPLPSAAHLQRAGRPNMPNHAARCTGEGVEGERGVSSQVSENAASSNAVHANSGKRAKGLEPSTFSLEG
ncbi:MAG: tyrosine-type recombinase/integrase [Phycisphaerae bacterium]